MKLRQAISYCLFSLVFCTQSNVSSLRAKKTSWSFVNINKICMRAYICVAYAICIWWLNPMMKLKGNGVFKMCYQFTVFVLISCNNKNFYTNRMTVDHQNCIRSSRSNVSSLYFSFQFCRHTIFFVWLIILESITIHTALWKMITWRKKTTTIQPLNMQ